MPRLRAMDMDKRMAGIAHAAAEIVILVEQEDRRIEATERQKQLPPDQQAGTGQERQAGVAPGTAIVPLRLR